MPAQSAFAAPRADVTDDQVTFSFPNTATFSATLSADANITSVTLEYGNEQQTCGDVIAKAYPEFTSAKTTPGRVDVGYAPKRITSAWRTDLVALALHR